MKQTSWLTSKVILLIILMLCGIGNIFAQTIYPAQATSVVRYKTGVSSPLYQYTRSSYAIGRANGSNGQNAKSDEDIIRSAYSFSLLNIPKDATINSVKLNISITGYQTGYGATKAKVVAVAQSATIGAGDQILFDAIGSGSTYFDELTYSTTYNLQQSSADFTTAVANALKNPSWNVFNIGVLSKGEGTNGTYANVSVSLEILYTPKVQITLQNSFNAGFIKVDGSTNTAHNSTVPFDKGSSHTLLAYAQTINDVTYSPDGTWTKVSTGETIAQNPLSITPMSNETYRANYTSAINTTIKNSFDGGFIRVNGSPIASGTVLPLAVNSTQYLEAYNQDFQKAGEANYFRLFQYWSITNGQPTTTNPLSIVADQPRVYTANFLKQYNLSAPTATYIESGSGGSYTVNGSNVGTMWQSTAVENSQTAITLGAVPPSGWTFVKWSDNLSTNPRTFIPTDHTTLSATYKYLHHTQTSTALANTSQRKVVSTNAGYQYLVYECMGHIWLERSTDEGATWSLCNNGPVDLGPEAKNPSIDLVNNRYNDPSNGVEVFITYQQKTSNGNYTIELARLNDAGIRLSTQTIFTSPSAYSNNANPVLSVTLFAHPNGIRKQIVGIWKEPAASGLNAGLYWYAASYDNSGFAINTPCNQIVNTNVESANPTIDVFKNDDAAYGGGQLLFHYAWEDHYNVRYQKIVCGLSGVTISGPFPALVASFGCPYPWHSLPSIAAISNSQAGLSWRAYYSDGVEFDESHAVFRFIDNGVINRFWFFGNYISSATINKNYDDLFGETSYAVGWTEVSGSAYSNFAVKNSGLTTPINLQCTGRDMQLCNANDFSSQRGIALGTASPYAFQSTAIVDPNWLGKNSSAHISAGRMGIVASGDAQFYFAIGDISVDGNAIDFKSLIDTVQIATMEDYKSYLISDPFTITDNSHFLYSVKYGVKDSTEALAALAQNPSVHFTVELIDDHTKQVIGKYDDVSYSLSHMQPHKNIAYEMNSKGIGNKTVRLRLSVLTTLADAQYALADMRAGSGSALNKITIERVKGTVTGLNPVTEYAIGQNYPNPFNPSTTISYAIPQPCTVNIKVYDMLGKEVATLVNEYKPSGRYEVSFNASQLSSGMYIYRIQAGSYTATKKMQLLK